MESENDTNNKSSFFSIGGFIGGLLLSGIVILVEYVKSSGTGASTVSLQTLIIVCLGCGVVGGLIGEKIVSKLWDFFNQFV